MIVGILKEIKAEGNRACMTTTGVEVMQQNGHTFLVEKDAGKGSGFDDAAYIDAGAEIVNTPKCRKGDILYYSCPQRNSYTFHGAGKKNDQHKNVLISKS